MDRPQLSISTSFDYSVPLEVQIPLISRAGFTHVSLGQDTGHSGIFEPRRREFLKYLLRMYNLNVDSIHGISLCYPNSTARMKPIIEAAADLRAPVVVAHPLPFDIGNADFTTLLSKITDCMNELEPLLKETGIKIAMENVLPGPSTDLAVRALEQADPAYFGFCYDSAHEQADGPHSLALLETMKDRVIGVHLSDWIKPFTDHVPPGEGVIGWPELTSQLKKSAFTGPLLFEVMVTNTSVKETAPFLELAYKQALWVDRLLDMGD